LDGKQIIHVGEEAYTDSVTVRLNKGTYYSVNVMCLQKKGGTPFLRVSWSWKGQEKVAVDLESLSFNEEQARWWNYHEKLEPAPIDPSSLRPIPADHRIVYYEPGRFAGWPANNGI